MKDRPRISPEQAFEASLRAALRKIKQGKGQCPDAETLNQFLHNELSAGDASRVKAHISGCGVCDLVLEKMQSLETALARPDDEPTPARAYALQKRIQKLLSQPGGQEDVDELRARVRLAFSSQHLGSLVVWFFRRPVFAYVIILLLIYPAYRGLRPRVRAASEQAKSAQIPPSPPVSFDMVPATLLQLEAVRGAEGPSSIVTLTEADSAFVLSFFVPLRNDSSHSYYAEVIDDKRSTVVTRAKLENNREGEFQLVCDRRLFEPGSYTLKIFETRLSTLGTENLLAQYEFSVEIHGE